MCNLVRCQYRPWGHHHPRGFDLESPSVLLQHVTLTCSWMITMWSSAKSSSYLAETWNFFLFPSLLLPNLICLLFFLGFGSAPLANYPPSKRQLPQSPQYLSNTLTPTYRPLQHPKVQSYTKFHDENGLTTSPERLQRNKSKRVKSIYRLHDMSRLTGYILWNSFAVENFYLPQLQ